MRIAHISDLHIARPPALKEYNAKRFLGYVNYRLFRRRRHIEQVAAGSLERLLSQPPDLLLLTGDITQHGLDAEFDAAENLLAPLAEAKVPVLAVAGNHDIYGRAGTERLDAFVRHVALGLTPDKYGLFHFPGVDLLPLAQGIPTPPFFSHGKTNPDELARAEAAWTKPPGKTMRLVCGHFPVIDTHGGRLLYFRGLREAERLLRFCEECQVRGYFCGHDHKRFSVSMPGGCIQYAAPSLSAVKDAGKEWVSVYDCAGDGKQPVDEGLTA